MNRFLVSFYAWGLHPADSAFAEQVTGISIMNIQNLPIGAEDTQ